MLNQSLFIVKDAFHKFRILNMPVRSGVIATSAAVVSRSTHRIPLFWNIPFRLDIWSKQIARVVSEQEKNRKAGELAL
jgi:hypothetical protein